jgi:FkbM family methyltransferase
LTTNAHVIAFEPDPRNLFCLTSTVMAMGPQYINRVTLFPIALGVEAMGSTINLAKGNMGGGIVGDGVPDHRRKEFHDPIPIRIERLDSILNTAIAEPWNVPVMKMDAEGFECNIMDGMGEAVSKRIISIKTELAPDHLSRQGCSGVGLIDRMGAAQFDTYFLGSVITTPPSSGISNIVAQKRNAV